MDLFRFHLYGVQLFRCNLVLSYFREHYDLNGSNRIIILCLHLQKKKNLRIKRERDGVEKQVPHTIESLRIPDETTVNITDEKQLETEKDHELDELSTYFSREVEPKVLITYCDNPHKVLFNWTFI